MRNQVQLIAYADRLAGSLTGLRELLEDELAALFGGVHLLPFFTPVDGADAGFDPVDHLAVDPRLGSWQDVGALAARTEVTADLIVNHISTGSKRFVDFLHRGERSRYAGMFLTYDRVFPHGATQDDLLRIYRPRPGLPFTPITLEDRSRRIAWTTFTSHQIDLDVHDGETRTYLRSILRRFAEHGISTIRADAVGYAIKEAGTSCFMIPETLGFVEELASWAREHGLEVLVEVHAHHETQIALADRVDWVYDFALPPLVLHALFTGDGRRLRHWLEVRPRNAVTVLDTHDGIGVLDVGADRLEPGRAGLLNPEEIDRLVERIHVNSSGDSRRATGAAASNVDLYQVNCTYYDALGRDDRRYLVARLLQLFVPGVPQIYYVGLLAGINDVALLEETGVGRDINRHRYTRDEIAEATRRPVVRRLFALIRFRNRHPAFRGDWSLHDTSPGTVRMSWQHGDHRLDLTVELVDGAFSLDVREPSGIRTVTDLLELPGAAGDR